MNSAPIHNVATRKAGAGQAWFLILAMFLPILAIIGLAPALPTLMDRFKDVPHATTLVPMLLTVPSLCIAIFGGLAGYLTDRFGRRNLMLGAMLVYLVGGVAPFFLETFQAVLISRVVLGIAEAFVMAIGNALLADYFSTEDRNKWLMVQGIVGPFLASFLLLGSGQLAAVGWQFPFLLYGLTLPIGTLGVIFIFEPQHRFEREQRTTATAFPWAVIAVICPLTLLTAIIYFVEPIQFSLVLREIGVMDPAMIGRISALASIAVPFGAVLFKRNAARTIQFQMALVFVLMGAGLLGIGLSHNYRLSAIAAVSQQLAAGMTVPTLVAWALSRLPREHRGRGMGFWAGSFFVGQFLSPLAVSILRELVGGLLHTVTLFGLICVAAAIISAINSGRVRVNLVPQGTS